MILLMASKVMLDGRVFLEHGRMSGRVRALESKVQQALLAAFVQLLDAEDGDSILIRDILVTKDNN